MLKVIDAVQEILDNSDLAREAMRERLLNLRAFARQIAPQVDEMTHKHVKIGTIVVTLSRLVENVRQTSPLKPDIILEEISIKSSLCDVTYEKTKTNFLLAQKFASRLIDPENHFFTITQGINEITFIISEGLKEKLITHFGHKPKSVYDNLVGVNVRFNEKYVSQPSVIYAILATLANKRINVLEVVSTFTELMVVVDKKEMEITLTQLNRIFGINSHR